MRSLWFGLLLLVLPSAAQADFSADPPWYALSLHFAEYEQAWGDSSAAVVLSHRQTTEVHFSTELFTRKYVDMIYAVFDARQAGGALDQQFIVPAGVEVKVLKAWAWNPGAETLTWSKDEDSRTTKLGFGYRDVRIAVPGLAGKGLCGVRLMLEWDGLNYVEGDFRSPYPLLDGQMTISVMQVGNTPYGDTPEALMARYFYFLVSGHLINESASLTSDASGFRRGKYGPEWHWTFKNLPAYRLEPLAPAQQAEPPTVYMLPRGFVWDGIQKTGATWLEGLKLPDGYLKEARQSLRGLTPGETVRELARRLDDPRWFRLRGDVRGFLAPTPPPFKLQPDGRINGTAMDKALLAGLLLKELGVRCCFSLGASQYRRSLDLDIPNYAQFDAILLQVPACGDRFYWDVADRSVPLGQPGPELYDRFLVMDPEADSPLAVLPPPAGAVEESRSTRITAADADGFTGTLRWNTQAAPAFDAEPWETSEDLAKELNEQFGSKVKVDSALWQTHGLDRRSGGDAGAELAARVHGPTLAAGDDELSLTLDLPLLPRPLMAAGRNPRRQTTLYLAHAYAFRDTVLVALPGWRYAGGPPPPEVRNKLGTCRTSVSDDASGVTLIREIHLPAQKIRPGDYALYRDLVSAWRSVEVRGFGIRRDGR